MELINDIERNNKLLNNNEQNNFLETTLGKVINTGIDIGIRAIFPDFLEDEIINIKDNIFNYGIADGIKETIDEAINLGKSAVGIFTGNFENVEQMQNAIEKGGLIDGISDLLSFAVDKAQEAGIINYSLGNTIEKGKDIILNNIESNIEKTFSEQIISVDKMNNYINSWKDSFENKDFEKMEKDYKKIQKELKNLVPLEKTLQDAKSIEILHNLIKNNGNNFNLKQEEMDLVNKLNK